LVLGYLQLSGSKEGFSRQVGLEGVLEHIAGRPRRRRLGRSGNEAARPSPKGEPVPTAGAMIFNLDMRQTQ
jgi:hypothetical protein